MKKNKLLLLSSILVLSSCANNEKNSTSEGNVSSSNNESISSIVDSSISESSSESKTDTYTTLYSSSEEVMIYGYVGMESFDLDSINFNRVASSKLTYSTSSDCILINNNKMEFVKKGVAVIEGYDDESSMYKINVVVNDSKENQYAYPEDIDLSTYTFRYGTKTNITATDSSITLNSPTSAVKDWTRVTYELNSNFNKDLMIEVDATLNSAIDNSRWFGLIFKDNESGANKAPYYQYDVRKKPSDSNGIELTYVSAYDSSNTSYTYSYAYQGKDDFKGTIMPGNTVHLTLILSGTTAIGYLDDSKEFETTIASANGGNIGFQTSGCSVTFSNLKICYANEDYNFEASKTITTANEKDSYINSNYSSSLRPNIIATGKNEDEIIGVGQNVTQLYAIAKEENGNLNLYDLDGNKMDITLEYLYKWYKGAYLVNLEVNDKSTVDLINKIMKAGAILDYAIFSSNNEILDYAHKVNSVTRLGYVSTASELKDNEAITSECQKAGKSNAYQIVIDNNLLDKSKVTAFTGRGYSVISKVVDGNVIDACLDGAANILVKYSSKASNEVKMIENDDIFASNSLFYQPYATAHRGAGTNGDTIDSNLCENTLSSFDKAFERGALALEIDVHTTSDDQLVVIHDDTTASISKQSISVKSSTLARLQSVKLIVGDDHIPSLKEVFERYGTEEYKDKTLVIEIKDLSFETGKKVIEMSKEYGWYGRYVLITFSDTTAKKLHDYDPTIPVGYLGTVYRNSQETFFDAYKTYYANGVGLSSNMACVDKECNEEHNARGEIHWIWTFGQSTNAKLVTYLNSGLRAMTTNNMRAFENNYYKLESTTNLTMAKGETKTLEAKAISYTGSNSIDDFEIILISGNATVNGTKITKNDDNEVEVCLKYKTTWKDNTTSLSSFYVYSDVITIK